MAAAPQAIILAGPNGSGKSTTATQILSADLPFVNADVIAQEISGVKGAVAEVSAGRILLERLAFLEQGKLDFVLETTLATKTLATRIKTLRAMGYDVHLFYLWLPSADMAVQRVADRVARGGHHVPEETIRRRYSSGLKNFFTLYMPLVNHWRLYDSSEPKPRLISSQQHGEAQQIESIELWTKIQEAVNS